MFYQRATEPCIHIYYEYLCVIFIMAIIIFTFLLCSPISTLNPIPDFWMKTEFSRLFQQPLMFVSIELNQHVKSTYFYVLLGIGIKSVLILCLFPHVSSSPNLIGSPSCCCLCQDTVELTTFFVVGFESALI